MEILFHNQPNKAALIDTIDQQSSPEERLTTEEDRNQFSSFPRQYSSPPVLSHDNIHPQFFPTTIVSPIPIIIARSFIWFVSLFLYVFIFFSLSRTMALSISSSFTYPNTHNYTLSLSFSLTLSLRLLSLSLSLSHN